MSGKKSSVKSAKKRFLYSHEYRDQKNGGEKIREANFSRNTQIVRKKSVGKKARKSAKKRFLYSHEYRDQKKVTK